MSYFKFFAKNSFLLGELQIVLGHNARKLLESDIGLPTQHGARLGGIPKQDIHFGWPKMHGVNFHHSFAGHTINPTLLYALSFPNNVHTQMPTHFFNKFAHSMRLASSQDEIIRLGMLQNTPYALHVIFGISPVTLSLQIAQMQ